MSQPTKVKKIKRYVITLSKKFLKGHPNEGMLTKFEQKYKSGEKIHTIRGNYELWKKRIDEVNAGIAALHIRTWSGVPYKSHQEELDVLTKACVQKFIPRKYNIHYGKVGPFFDDIEKDVTVEEIASHDGLTLFEFSHWFAGAKPGPMAIIHFTDFRY